MKTATCLALLSILLCSAVATPLPAEAFFQKTTLEGTLGQDISGVWLVVHHVMPTFRVRVERDPANVAPFKVGPVPKTLAPAAGPALKGVAIKEFTDPKASENYGLFVGDLITAVNTTPVANEAEFAKALSEVKEWFLVTVHRSSLKYSTARLVKIKYAAAERKTEGASELGTETLEIRVSESELPFADQLEASRTSGNFFVPTKAQIEKLKQSWYKLPVAAKPIYVNGDHRVVAAAAYDASLREDKNLDASTFAIVSTLQGNPLAGGGGRNIVIYGFEKVTADSASGSYVDSTIATAPFPISIEFHGRFEMIKLAPYSDKDVEYQTAAAREAAVKSQAAENKKIELAPDVPAVIPQPKDQPAVAE